MSSQSLAPAVFVFARKLLPRKRRREILRAKRVCVLRAAEIAMETAFCLLRCPHCQAIHSLAIEYCYLLNHYNLMCSDTCAPMLLFNPHKFSFGAMLPLLLLWGEANLIKRAKLGIHRNRLLARVSYDSEWLFEKSELGGTTKSIAW